MNEQRGQRKSVNATWKDITYNQEFFFFFFKIKAVLIFYGCLELSLFVAQASLTHNLLQLPYTTRPNEQELFNKARRESWAGQ